MSKIQGFELFDDIEDTELRTRNQAVVLANMYQDGCRDGKVTAPLASRILKYFGALPEASRGLVREKFIVQMRERGFRLG